MADVNDWVEVKAPQKDLGDWAEVSAKQPLTLKRANEELYGPGGLTNEKVGAAAGNALGIMAPSSGLADLIGAKFPKLATIAGMATPVAEDATIASAQSPGHRGEAFLKGAGTSALMRGTSAALDKGGDYLAQKAAGIRETKPGRGNALMDEGVFGTKGMQQSQVAKKLGERGEDLAATVAGLKDPVSAMNTVQALDAAAEKLKINGVIPSNQTALYKQYTDLSNSLKSMTQGEGMAIAAPEYQKFKQAQGDVAYNANGKMLDTNVAAAAGLANRESANDISAAFAGENPGVPNPYREKNAKLSALFGAKRGLESKTSLSDLAGIAAMGGIGYAADGPQGALAAALLKAPITKSVGAYAGRYGSKAVGAAASPVARTLTITPPEQKDDWVEIKK